MKLDDHLEQIVKMIQQRMIDWRVPTTVKTTVIPKGTDPAITFHQVRFELRNREDFKPEFFSADNIKRHWIKPKHWFGIALLISDHALKIVAAAANAEKMLEDEKDKKAAAARKDPLDLSQESGSCATDQNPV